MTSKQLKNGTYRNDLIVISFRATQEEWKVLDKYCREKAVTKSSVLRMAIQRLEKKMKDSAV